MVKFHRIAKKFKTKRKAMDYRNIIRRKHKSISTYQPRKTKTGWVVYAYGWW